MATLEVSAERGERIQTAIDEAGPGDVIRVGAGTYDERPVLRGKNFSVVSVEPRLAVTKGFVFPIGSGDIRLTGFRCDGGSIDYAGRGHVIEGNHVRNARVTGIGGESRRKNGRFQSDDVVIRDNLVERCQAGIGVVGHNITMIGNTVRRLVQHTNDDVDFVRFFGDGLRIADNFLDGRKNESRDNAHCDCFQSWVHVPRAGDVPVYLRNVVIEGNTCIGKPLAINEDPRGDKGVIAQCVMVECAVDGMVEDIVIRDNVACNMSAWGFMLHGMNDHGGPLGVEISYNTLYGIGLNLGAGNSAIAAYGNGDANLHHNLIVKSRGGADIWGGMTGRVDSNVVYSLMVPYDGVVIDPIFTSPGTGDTADAVRESFRPGVAMDAGIRFDRVSGPGSA